MGQLLGKYVRPLGCAAQGWARRKGLIYGPRLVSRRSEVSSGRRGAESAALDTESAIFDVESAVFDLEIVPVSTGGFRRSDLARVSAEVD
jgi:hypothetical protein